MAKKTRTKAQRSAAAKAAHARRRAALSAGNPNVVASTNPYTESTVAQVLMAPGYGALSLELQAAFAQSSEGKGKERHANGRAFDRQPILELGRLYGPGYAAGQAAKKTQEALGMLSRGDRDKALFEVHGAIVYLAALASLLREGGNA